VKPAYLRPDTTHRDRWMVSYLDAMTILLAFFVAATARLYSTEHKNVAVTPPPPTLLVDARKPPEDPTIQKLKDAGLDAQMEPRGIVVRLPQAVFFSSGDDRIHEEALPTVAKIAEILRDMPNEVMLIGHADSVPIHNRRFKSNWELSAARGLRLLEALSSTYGIAENRISVSSEGANRPAASNETASGRAGNRRVEIVILPAPKSPAASSDSSEPAS
jgi:chemotaxis protein MotB